MERGLLKIASTFTAMPLASALRAGLHLGEQDVGFILYEQVVPFMLQPGHLGLSGIILLVRVEDWLRQEFKSKSAKALPEPNCRQILQARLREFESGIGVLSRSGLPVLAMICPSVGWIANRAGLQTLFRTYSNLLAARLRRLPISTLAPPAFLTDALINDHGADRLGHMPYTQDGFDRLGEFLASQVADSLQPASPAIKVSDGHGTQLKEYLTGLQLQVNLSLPRGSTRPDIDRLLRTAAGFSLTGERPYLSDQEVDQLLARQSGFAVSVSDRASDYGVSGFVFFKTEGSDLLVDSMALSCVVLGKQVEHAVVSAIGGYAFRRGLRRLLFRFAATGRNQPMQEFLESIATQQGEHNYYVVEVASIENSLATTAPSPGAWAVSLNEDRVTPGVVPQNV